MEYSVENIVKPLLYKEVQSVANSKLINWDKLKESTVLITGANGFIGYYLVTALLERNDKFKSNITVLAVVRSKENAEKTFGELLKRNDIQLVVQDVCQELIIEQKADYVMHLASKASPYHFENDPIGIIDANVTGTYNVLNYAKESSSKATLFVSSLKVYGNLHNGKDDIKETDIGYLEQTSYKNCYAQGKRTAETICASFNKEYKMNVKIARPAYIYGASSLDDDRVWANFFANAVRGENILLKSNGGAYRSFCYVTDTAVALFLILLEGENVYPYNISSKESNVTIRNFARAVTETFIEKNIILEFAKKDDELEPMRSPLEPTPEILNNARLKGLGFKAEVSLKEGIEKSVNILAEQNNV